MATDNMERLEHIQLIIQMEAGALSLILASRRGLNVPQIRKTQQNLRTALDLLEQLVTEHFKTLRSIKNG